jgi:hypothetical protein
LVNYRERLGNEREQARSPAGALLAARAAERGNFDGTFFLDCYL